MKSRIWLSTQDSGFVIFICQKLRCLLKRKGHVTGQHATVYGRHNKLLLRSIKRASSNKCSQSWADTGKKEKGKSQTSLETSELVWQRQVYHVTWSRTYIHCLGTFGKLTNSELSSRLNFNLYSRNQSVEIKR